jgi:hypothetical protein
MKPESDLQRLLKGDFKPKDPTEHERMQRAFVAERPSLVDIENIQDPATKAMIKKWDKMFPVKPVAEPLFEPSLTDVIDIQRENARSEELRRRSADGWPFPLGGYGFLG